MRAFFFAPESPRPLALVRIALTLALFWEAAGHWPHAVELYSTSGPALPFFVRAEIVDDGRIGENGRFPRRIVAAFHPPVPGPLLAVVLATLHLAVLAAAALGWRTRLSLAASFALSLGLGLLDGVNFAKYTVLALHVLAILAVSQSGRVLSLDAWFGNRDEGACPVAPAWPRRLIQLVACHVYLGAALHKLRIPSFFTGDLLANSLLDPSWGGGRLGHWLSTQHAVVPVLSLASFALEFLFPFLVWVRPLRRPFLIAALLLHAGMGLLLNIGIFSPVMMAALLAFLDERDLRWLPRRTASPEIQRRGGRWLSAGLYAAAVAIWVGLGAGLQVWRDDYGVFGRRTLPGPELVAKADAEDMLWPVKPSWEHYVHRLALGTRVNGPDVFGPGRVFRAGERLLVSTRFLAGHPPLRLEGLLVGPDGGEAARFTRPVDSGTPSVVNGFELSRRLPPGDYVVILQIEGFEVARRDVDIVGP